MSRKAQSLHRLGEYRRHLPVAVYDKHMGGLFRGEVLYPVHQMVVVGVGGKSLEIHDLGPHGDFLAEQLHAGCAVQQVPPQRAWGLEAHEHHGAVAPPQVVLQVMADTPRVAHTAGGDDDLGGLVDVQQLGLVHRLRQVQARKIEHVGAVLHQCQRVLVQIAPQVAAKDGGGLLGQRTVHIHREVLDGRHQSLILDLPDEVQQLLGAAHGKGGDHHIAALGQRLVDDLRQLVGVAPHLRVVAVAVGGFHQHVVGAVEKLGVADDGLIHIADITGEHHGPRLAALTARQFDAGGAQQVPGVDELRRYVVCDLYLLAVLAGLDILPHLHGVGHGVDGLHLRPAGPLVLAVLVLRVLLLDVGGVLQHDVQQIRRQPRGDDAALEPVFDEHGDAPRVVDVGVGHQHHVDAARMERQGGVVDLVPSLLQAAVHQYFLSVDLQTMAAAGNALVSAVKAQLHGGNSFSKLIWESIPHFSGLYNRKARPFSTA